MAYGREILMNTLEKHKMSGKIIRALDWMEEEANDSLKLLLVTKKRGADEEEKFQSINQTWVLIDKCCGPSEKVGLSGRLGQQIRRPRHSPGTSSSPFPSSTCDVMQSTK